MLFHTSLEYSTYTFKDGSSFAFTSSRKALRTYSSSAICGMQTHVSAFWRLHRSIITSTGMPLTVQVASAIVGRSAQLHDLRPIGLLQSMKR